MRVFPPALSIQAVGRQGFTGPGGYLAVRIRDVDMDLRVRIHPVHFYEFAFERDGLADVEFGRERMVRQHWQRGQEQPQARAQERAF